VGGADRIVTLLARGLAERGHDVSVVTWDEGQEEGATAAGVRIHKMCRPDAGVRRLRFFHPRWTSLRAALARADADVYVQTCAGHETGQVAHFCRARGRRFVYWVASDADCDPRLPLLRTRRDRVLYRYGLRRADEVIAQTAAQQRALAQGFARRSVVLPMPCAGPDEGAYVPQAAPPERAERPRVLWIGRIIGMKRPDRLLEVAALCPEIGFDLVGPLAEGAGDEERRTLERARAAPNIHVRGPIERGRLDDVYRRAACLLCTSDTEGFPNTFLEAWSQGLPVVTTFDPDGLVAARGLGAVAAPGDTRALVAALRRLLADPIAWREASARARRYWVSNLRPEAAIPHLLGVLQDGAVPARAGDGGGRGQG
jgi:glycosyltransferase involved in cell wall biosynthesis